MDIDAFKTAVSQAQGQAEAGAELVVLVRTPTGFVKAHVEEVMAIGSYHGVAPSVRVVVRPEAAGGPEPDVEAHRSLVAGAAGLGESHGG